MVNIKSIQVRLVICFFLITLVPLIVLGAITYKVSSSIIQKDVSKQANQVMGQVIENIDFYLSDMENVSSDILFNSSIRENLKRCSGRGDTNEIIAHNAVRSDLIKVLSARKSLKSISIIKNNNVTFSTSYGIVPELLTAKDWYQEAIKQDGKPVFVTTDPKSYGIQNVTDQSASSYAITLVKKMMDIYTGKQTGVLLVDIHYRILENIMQKLNSDDNYCIYVIDSYGNIVYKYCNNPIIEGAGDRSYSDIGSGSEGNDIKSLNGHDVMRIYKTSDLSGWRIVEIVPYNYLMSPVRRIGNLTLALIAICIFFVLVISVFVSRGILKPLRHLGRLMFDVENGNLNVKISPVGDDEVGKLGKSFNNMVFRLREMHATIYKEQELKREAELSALQAQINPHFLYNTLDSIKWMAMVQGNHNICEMITSFVSLLRNSINKGREIISIQQEVNNVVNFIKIQRLRYYNSFDIDYHIDESALQCGIPKLILQPLVENALFHGLENNTENGKIGLVIRKIENNITCEISDNGKGMSNEELDGIFDEKIRHKFSGISVKNVNERLKLHFGEGYGLKYYSEMGTGTKVEVTIPAVFVE